MKPGKAIEIAKKSKNIHGWFSTEAAMFFAWIDEIQKVNGVVGDIFEIGCHHGKSTVVLGAMVEPQKEKICVCDLFDDQGTNISGSGQGDLEILKQNMAFTLKAGVEMQIFQKNSNALNVEEVGNHYRFFHIDGGHNCEEALFDLRLAAACITEKGVIVLDDPFTPTWPGVTEALIRFLDEYKDFCAIVVGFNKLILTRTGYADLYVSEIQEPEKRQAYGLGYPCEIKVLPFNGYPLQIFYVPTYLAKKSLSLFLRKYYIDHSWIKKNPFLRPFVTVIKAVFRKI